MSFEAIYRLIAKFAGLFDSNSRSAVATWTATALASTLQVHDHQFTVRNVFAKINYSPTPDR